MLNLLKSKSERDKRDTVFAVRSSFENIINATNYQPNTFFNNIQTETETPKQTKTINTNTVINNNILDNSPKDFSESFVMSSLSENSSTLEADNFEGILKNDIQELSKEFSDNTTFEKTVEEISNDVVADNIEETTPPAIENEESIEENTSSTIEIEESIEENTSDEETENLEENINEVEEEIVKETNDETITEATEEKGDFEDLFDNNEENFEANIVDNVVDSLVEDEISQEEDDDEVEYKHNIKDNHILLISEDDRKVFLPYTAEEIEEYLRNYPDKYSDEYDVIRNVFILPLGYFNNFFYATRFREAYALYKDREGYPSIPAIASAFKIMSIKNLHPAIIAACKNEKILKDYLHHLEIGDLENFTYFEINYRMNPLV